MTRLTALPVYMTAKDLQAALGISKPTAYKLMHREDFPTVKLGERKLVISREDFRDWCKNNFLNNAEI